MSTMTVKDLKKILENVDENLPVALYAYENGEIAQKFEVSDGDNLYYKSCSLTEMEGVKKTYFILKG